MSFYGVFRPGVRDVCIPAPGVPLDKPSPWSIIENGFLYPAKKWKGRPKEGRTVQPYQEEYLDNLRQFNALFQRQRRPGLDFETYAAQMREDREEILRLSRRNMELLRRELFPSMESLYGWGPQEVAELEEFSFQLYDGRTELDVGLFCQIHQALLGLARFNGDRDAVIRELYWMGMGSNALSSKLVGLPLADIQEYTLRMRQYFIEAAGFLEDFDEIDSTETRGYILRSRANISLGQFPTAGEKTRLLKETLNILQNKHYQELAPDLPWDRFIYLTHQNMTSSISHSREKVMSPEEMAAIMSSAVIVYQGRYEVGERLHQQPAARPAFGYHAMEFYCGLRTLETFLTRLEELLDGAVASDYSPNGMYAMISLPAFYSLYLSQYPDRIPPREEYLQGLYQRMLDYADAYPGELGNHSLFLYLRQLCFTFIETGGGIPYSQFLLKLLLRFAPEVYRHSHLVGEGAQALCAALLEDDPDYFDDIDFIREISGRSEKRTAVLDYAMGCGLFHDSGKVSVIELCSRTARQWLDEEYEMARLHTVSGNILLEGRASTRRYAPIALGHHAWYSGGSQSYPDTYHRSECPERRMVDVISLVDWLEVRINSAHMYRLEAKPFEQVVQEAVQMGGTRFSPRLTERLLDEKTAERLRAALEAATGNAYRKMYEDALG